MDSAVCLESAGKKGRLANRSLINELIHSIIHCLSLSGVTWGGMENCATSARFTLIVSMAHVMSHGSVNARRTGVETCVMEVGRHLTI